MDKPKLCCRYDFIKNKCMFFRDNEPNPANISKCKLAGLTAAVNNLKKDQWLKCKVKPQCLADAMKEANCRAVELAFSDVVDIPAAASVVKQLELDMLSIKFDVAVDFGLILIALKHIQLNSLYVESSTLTDETLDALTSLFENNQTIESLTIRTTNQTKDACFNVMLRTLYSMPKLRRLILDHNDISDEMLFGIGSTVQLKLLSLEKSNLSKVSNNMYVYINMLHNLNVLILDLQANNINAIKRTLYKTYRTSLKMLRLTCSGNDMSPVNVDHMSYVLLHLIKTSSFTHITMCMPFPNVRSYDSINSALLNNHIIQHIEFKDNKVQGSLELTKKITTMNDLLSINRKCSERLKHLTQSFDEEQYAFYRSEAYSKDRYEDLIKRNNASKQQLFGIMFNEKSVSLTQNSMLQVETDRTMFDTIYFEPSRSNRLSSFFK